MYLNRLEITQKVINFLGLRNKERLAQESLPTEIVALVQVRDKILYVKHTTDIVLCLAIDRNTRIGVLLGTL